jgi:hypothetical protein
MSGRKSGVMRWGSFTLSGRWIVRYFIGRENEIHKEEMSERTVCRVG